MHSPSWGDMQGRGTDRSRDGLVRATSPESTPRRGEGFSGDLWRPREYGNADGRKEEVRMFKATDVTVVHKRPG